MAMQNIFVFIPCNWVVNTSDRYKLQVELIRTKYLFAWNGFSKRITKTIINNLKT